MSTKLFLLMLSAFSAFKAHQDLPKLSSLKPTKSGKKKSGGSSERHNNTETMVNNLVLTGNKPRIPLRPKPAILNPSKAFKPVFPNMGTRSAVIYNPVKGARMSSQFGYRHHPILKKRKLHKGMDFAAPIGTPVRAAADGKIVKAKFNGGYGHYIRIKHKDGSMETAYAHLSRYKRGLKAGQMVKKNEIIGYVGTSGRSTGPHLHFELIKNGKHVNPKHFMV